MNNTVKKAMILAAGKGTRMRPLTDNCPKPLVNASGKALIEYPLAALKKAGFESVVINHAYLGQMIEDHLGESFLDIAVHYSPEEQGLETGGGIFNALSLLTDGKTPFLVLNGDVYAELDITTLPVLAEGMLAHLVLIPNPSHNLKGDFVLGSNGQVSNLAHMRQENVSELSGQSELRESYTFSGISILHPDLFMGCEAGIFPLAPLLRKAIEQNKVTGSIYSGYWQDVGTVERLAALEKHLEQRI